MLTLAGWLQGRIDSMDMLHPTGEWSARLMIFAMMIGPLVSLFGPRPWINWLVVRRRYLGVGAFLYAVLHLIFYIIDMGNVDDMLAEFLAPGIWTGWAALAIMIPLAATSNDAAMRALKSGWKRLQRLVYPAAVLTLLHWMWVHNSYTGALGHFAPLGLLWLARFIKPLLNKPPVPKGA
jgi:methionine sulfoxide reductase heme-binding subunit